jgi:hypothetical protein
MQLYISNVGVREIGFLCGVSNSLVLKRIKRMHDNLKAKIDMEKKVEWKGADLIEMDEIEI